MKIKMKVPKSGQLGDLDRRWREMESAHKKVNDALKKGKLKRDDFKKLWEDYVKAEKTYRSVGESIPEVEIEA